MKEQEYEKIEEKSSLDHFINNLSPEKKLIGFLVSFVVGLLISMTSYVIFFDAVDIGQGIGFILLNLFGITCLIISTLFLKKPSEQMHKYADKRLRLFSIYLFVISSIALYLMAILEIGVLKEIIGAISIIL